MAKGWESKSVEEQIIAAEAQQEAREKRALSASETARRRQKASLEMERARIMREMQGTQKQPYIAMLTRTLTHIETEIAKLEP